MREESIVDFSDISFNGIEDIIPGINTVTIMKGNIEIGQGTFNCYSNLDDEITVIPYSLNINPAFP